MTKQKDVISMIQRAKKSALTSDDKEKLKEHSSEEELQLAPDDKIEMLMPQGAAEELTAFFEKWIKLPEQERMKNREKIAREYEEILERTGVKINQLQPNGKDSIMNVINFFKNK